MTKASIKISILLIAAITSILHVHAQSNTYPVISSEVTTTCISNCLTVDSIFQVTDSSLIQVNMTIQLFEVTGITSLHVKLGTSSGGSDLLDKTFAFDVSGDVGNFCTFSRNDYTVLLGLGSYNGLTFYFSELILEKVDHSFTDAIVFNR